MQVRDFRHHLGGESVRHSIRLYPLECHIAKWFVEITRVLLESGGNPNDANAMGERYFQVHLVEEGPLPPEHASRPGKL